MNECDEKRAAGYATFGLGFNPLHSADRRRSPARLSCSGQSRSARPPRLIFGQQSERCRRCSRDRGFFSTGAFAYPPPTCTLWTCGERGIRRFRACQAFSHPPRWFRCFLRGAFQCFAPLRRTWAPLPVTWRAVPTHLGTDSGGPGRRRRAAATAPASSAALDRRTKRAWTEGTSEVDASRAGPAARLSEQ